MSTPDTREDEARAWDEGWVAAQRHAALVQNYLHPLGISSRPPEPPSNPYRGSPDATKPTSEEMGRCHG